MTNNKSIQKIGLELLKGLALFAGLLASPLAQTQTSRPTPGANLGVNSPGSGSSSLVHEEVAKLGDYVEIDASIKNDLYGTIDFPNAELKDIIKAISKLAKKNFILDRKIENRRITILSPEAVTKQEAYNAFLSALYMNDLTIVSEGKFLKVIDVKSALQSNIRVFMGDYAPNTAEVITVLYPMKFLNAEDIQRYLTDLVPRSGRIAAYPNTNTLVMTDTGFNLRRVIQIIQTIDVPGHEDQLETIPIRYASAKDIAKLVDEILSAQSGGSSGARRGSTRSTQQKTRGGGIITKIVPDERTNSLVVLANGRGIQELKDLIRQLDSSNAAGGGNIHLYYCKNAVAEELAATINTLISGATSKNDTTQNRAANDPRILPINRLNSRSSSSDDAVRFEGNLKVTADKATNSLVVVGSAADFGALKKVLEKLDIPRRQVYVEATIMEISLDNNFKLEVAANLAGPGIPSMGGFIPAGTSIDFTKLASSPAAFSGLLAGFTSGAKYRIPGTTAQISTITGLISALENYGQAQILHTPQILTSDNQDAEIKVETKISTITNEAVAGAGGAVPNQRVEKTPVTVSLKITPQLGENSDLIRLKVEQNLDSFAISAAAGQIDTTTRKATTSVVVRNGDTIAIGGLQKTETSDLRSRIPILGDLPIIGKLFGNTRSEGRRSVLMILLKPRIIERYEDMLNITSEKLDDRLTLGKRARDPEDRLRKEVLALKKENQRNLAKPSPKTWGFKSKSGQPNGPTLPPQEDEAARISAETLEALKITDPSGDASDPSQYLPEYEPIDQNLDDQMIPPPALEASPSDAPVGGGA